MRSKIPIKIKIIIIFIIQVLVAICIGFTPVQNIVNRFMGTASVYIILILLFGVFYYIILNSLILNHIVNMKKNMSSSQGEGDLTKRLPVHHKDEIGIFSRHFNIFLANIHNIVFKLKNIAKIGKGIGENLESRSTDIASAVNEMNANIHSLKNNGRILDDHIKVTQKDIIDIKESINAIVSNIASQNSSITESSSYIKEMLQSIDNINQISESKRDLLSSLQEQIVSNKQNMSKTIESISTIAESADIIQEFIGIIRNVSDKTSILSINAAIEAAHAGEWGKGFKIVADEIRTLSTSTDDNTAHIANNLNNIIVKIKDLLSLTKNTGQAINAMTEYIQNVAASMNEIIKKMQAISANNNKVSQSLKKSITIASSVENSSRQIDEKSGKVNDSMHNLVQISTQNRIALDEISVGVSQISQSISHISSLGVENAENNTIIEQNISRFTIIDTALLKSSDGRPLIQWNSTAKKIPPRPDNSLQYPEDDERHWYDMEYAGWQSEKINIPESPADGAKKKYIFALQPVKHPYQEAHKRGMQKIADAFGIRISSFCAEGDPILQAQQVDLAIKSKPDLIIIAPISSEFSTEWYKKINTNDIPIIVSNMTPNDEGFKYILAWRGPDDWAQTRQLAHRFAELLNYEGGYCCIRHRPGTSVFLSRTMAFITELRKIAPKMICLEKGSPNFDEEKTYTMVSGWIKKYGNELKGIMSADDSSTALGATRAFNSLNRNDIRLVTSGHSKIGLDLMKEGKIQAMTIQSAESDGALAVEAAIDWFNGLEMIPIKYLPIQIITKEEVDLYYPPQW